MKPILIVGLVPALARYDLFTDWTAERVTAVLAEQGRRLAELGYAPEPLYLTFEDDVDARLAERMAGKDYGCVVIGAGVRLPPDQLVFFERLVNAVHRHAPGARIAFNTNPGDTVDAVLRWV
jgi:hypothetical protein